MKKYYTASVIVIFGISLFAQSCYGQWLNNERISHSWMQHNPSHTLQSEHLFARVTGDGSLYLVGSLRYGFPQSIDNEYFLILQERDIETGDILSNKQLLPPNISRSTKIGHMIPILTEHGVLTRTLHSQPDSLQLSEFHDYDGNLVWSINKILSPNAQATYDTSSYLASYLTNLKPYSSHPVILNLKNGTLDSIFLDGLADTLENLYNKTFNKELGPPLFALDSCYLARYAFRDSVNNDLSFINVKLDQNMNYLNHSSGMFNKRFSSSRRLSSYVDGSFSLSVLDSSGVNFSDSSIVSKLSILNFNWDTTHAFTISGDYFGNIPKYFSNPSYFNPLLRASKDFFFFSTWASSPHTSELGSEVHIFDSASNLISKGRIFVHNRGFIIDDIFHITTDGKFYGTTRPSYSLYYLTQYSSDWRVFCLDTSLKVDSPAYLYIDDQSSRASQINLFPNPVQSTFEISGILPIDNYTLTIFDGFNRLVFRISFNSIYHRYFDVENLSSGLYFWRIENQTGGSVASGKLLKE